MHNFEPSWICGFPPHYFRNRDKSSKNHRTWIKERLWGKFLLVPHSLPLYKGTFYRLRFQFSCFFISKFLIFFGRDIASQQVWGGLRYDPGGGGEQALRVLHPRWSDASAVVHGARGRPFAVRRGLQITLTFNYRYIYVNSYVVHINYKKYIDWYFRTVLLV